MGREKNLLFHPHPSVRLQEGTSTRGLPKINRSPTNAQIAQNKTFQPSICSTATPSNPDRAAFDAFFANEVNYLRFLPTRWVHLEKASWAASPKDEQEHQVFSAFQIN